MNTPSIIDSTKLFLKKIPIRLDPKLKTTQKAMAPKPNNKMPLVLINGLSFG